MGCWYHMCNAKDDTDIRLIKIQLVVVPVSRSFVRSPAHTWVIRCSHEGETYGNNHWIFMDFSRCTWKRAIKMACVRFNTATVVVVQMRILVLRQSYTKAPRTRHCQSTVWHFCRASPPATQRHLYAGTRTTKSFRWGTRGLLCLTPAHCKLQVNSCSVWPCHSVWGQCPFILNFRKCFFFFCKNK